jgi:hypothetical protein
MQLQPCKPRAPRTTRVQQLQWIERFRNSGLTRHAFAQEHGLKISTLDRWLARAGHSASPVSQPVLFKELPRPVVLNGSGQSWSMEILTPSGLIVRLR